MEHTIISIILIFNIAFLVLYFIIKFNRRSFDRACKDTSCEFLDENSKKTITSKEHQWIDSFIFNPEIPSALSRNPSFAIKTSNADIQFINKGEMDKGTIEYGIVINSITNNKSINLLPISFLEKTKNDIFYLKNDQNLIGLFTPFHIILFDTVNLNFTRSFENEQAEKIEGILLNQLYTRSQNN